ncbi:MULTISPECIES: helix-turn-helix domain-containing protein [Streptococcus]|uniref:HTH cro/C1-type domain-containing protein n=1 Tax=Streptococcus parauberis KRS-02083 TaxID=1207545 RepID=A0ABN0IPF0_9STRE|nr:MULTISPECIES: helix-turn-helix transcriptional regulator [Streptococcus]EMG24682.1 hypothetical protein SPJ1_1941 [Streptococcus parauberis KRS-02083]QBX27552.1 hypothetical protein Javan394_0041 [Streptococcus phage Javan394]WOF47116.1 helix-turn-helix domain-containing protein [Streptococcus parauberis]
MALYTEEQKVNISKNINFIRMQKGETLAEFGERLNTSRMTVNNWEKKRNAPKLSNILKIAIIADVTVHDFINNNFAEKRNI